MNPSAPSLALLVRIGVVVFERGSCVLTTQNPGGARGLPGVPIRGEHMNIRECAAALSPHVELFYGVAMLRKITEFDGEWDSKAAHIIIFLLEDAAMSAPEIHSSAEFTDLSRSLTVPFGPTMTKLLGARAHAGMKSLVAREPVLA